MLDLGFNEHGEIVEADEEDTSASNTDETETELTEIAV